MRFNDRLLWSKPKQTDSAEPSPSLSSKRFRSPCEQAQPSLSSVLNISNEAQPSMALGHLDSESSRKLFQKLTSLCLQTGITVVPNKPPALLAPEYQDEPPTIKTAIARLLPDYVAPLWTEVDVNESNHAEALETLIDATQCNLRITDLDSFKDADTNRCTVSFRHGEKPIQWTFVEPDNYLSGNFMRAALSFIGECAEGKFHRLYIDNGYHYYVFIPDKLNNALLSSKKMAVENATYLDNDLSQPTHHATPIQPNPETPRESGQR